MPIMSNDAIDITIFSTILRIRKKNNRADIDSNYKETTKAIDFEDVTKKFHDDRIHTLINDKKIINERNRNADSNYVKHRTCRYRSARIAYSFTRALKISSHNLKYQTLLMVPRY